MDHLARVRREKITLNAYGVTPGYSEHAGSLVVTGVSLVLPEFELYVIFHSPVGVH